MYAVEKGQLGACTWEGLKLEDLLRPHHLGFRNTLRAEAPLCGGWGGEKGWAVATEAVTRTGLGGRAASGALGRTPRPLALRF